MSSVSYNSSLIAYVVQQVRDFGLTLLGEVGDKIFRVLLGNLTHCCGPYGP